MSRSAQSACEGSLLIVKWIKGKVNFRTEKNGKCEKNIILPHVTTTLLTVIKED